MTESIRTVYEDDDTLLISGIQHFAFCRRQWALIHIESQWSDNAHTVTGELLHTNAHNPVFTEKRSGLIVTHGMPVFSRSMRVHGVCDVVEFRQDSKGVTLFGRKGLWIPCPVEYKKGRPKTHNSDSLQLCAQAMCLEEMLLCMPIGTAFLYHGETKHREAVSLSEELRKTVRKMFSEMHEFYDRRYTPRVKPTKSCGLCSMNSVCLPSLPTEQHVAGYIKKALIDIEE